MSFAKGLAFATGLLATALLAVTVSGTVSTFSSGDVVSASSINQNFASLKAAIEGLPECSEYSVHVTSSGSQNILDSGTVVANIIDWDTETFDAQAMHDNSTNPARLTIRLAGRYLVSGRITIAGSNFNNRSLWLYKNGSFVALNDYQAGNNGHTSIQLTEIMDLAAGDYVEIAASQSTGGALTTDPTRGDMFSAMRICGD